jgi:hypothetical protein
MRATARNSFDTRSQRFGDRFLLALALLLLGYAIAGKGVAYAGVPPLYIGEMVLMLGLVAWLQARGWSKALNVPAMLALVPLVVLGFIGLARCLMEYQIEAVRDAMIWGYAAFALCVATLLVSDPRRLPKLMLYYRRFIPVFLAGVLVAFALFRFARPVLPTWPGTNTPLIFVKEGDVLVHLAGILAFWMADPKRSVRWAWAVLLTIDMSVMGVIDRAGVLSFGAVMMLCLIAKPRHGAAWRTISMLVAGLVLLYGSNIRVPVPGGKGRDISFDQFVINVRSTFGSSDIDGLDSTKEWRLQWWGKIVNYTVHGPYFWTGKGFGVNLADDDGFQVQQDHSLRSPHSAHMTILARMGVPGAVAWALMHLVWFATVADAWYRARRRGDQRWAGWFLFLFAYYLAFVINASFDVFLEGPMGGIWFWTIYGAGVGSLWIYRYRPDVLADDDAAGAAGRQGGQQGGRTNEDPDRAQFLPAAGRRRPGVPLGTGAARVARA